MKSNIVGYCWSCAKDTEHKIIKCTDSTLWRTFEAVATLGFGLLLEKDYYCKCKECGDINILRF